MSLAADTHGFLSPTGVEIAFLLVGLVTLGAAVVTVTTRQLVHAALWLVVALGGLAVEYLLLTAEFIAWVQVLIYVGSVVVLLLFGLMLTRAPIGRSPDADSGNRWAALAVAVAAAASLVWVVTDAFRTTWVDLDGPAAGSTEATGAGLFQNWVLPFEALSVLLLAALVGAIVLSRKARADKSSPPMNSRGSGTSSPPAPRPSKESTEPRKPPGPVETNKAPETPETPETTRAPGPAGTTSAPATPGTTKTPATPGTPETAEATEAPRAARKPPADADTPAGAETATDTATATPTDTATDTTPKTPPAEPEGGVR